MLVIRDCITWEPVAELHFDFLPDEDRERIMQAVQRAMNYRRPLEFVDTLAD